MEQTTAPRQGTVTITKMYGVTHGGQISTPLIPGDLQLTLKPSSQMLRELEVLSKGTRVGIETLSPAELPQEERVLSKVGLHANVQDRKYWNPIISTLEKSGLILVYLDELSQYDTLLKLEKEFKELESLLRLGLAERKRDVRTVIRKQHSVGVQIEFDLAFRRHNQLVKRIIETAPQVIVIGDGHAGRIWVEQKQNVPNGLQIEGYSAETFPDVSSVSGRLMGAIGVIESRVALENYISQVIPENGFVSTPCEYLGDEPIRRKYWAVTKGRITDAVPNYIGTWDLEVPARGLFEMFIKERETGESGKVSITGTIEDGFGSASFTGYISGSSIHFGKEYNALAVKQGATRSTILYNGIKASKDGIKGAFTIDGFEGRRPFQMHEFEPGKALNVLMRS